MRPDPVTGRVEGTSYPGGVAPAGAVPLDERVPRFRDRIRVAALRVLIGGAVSLLRPRPDDVIVLRTDEPMSAEFVFALNTSLRKVGHRGVVLSLPREVYVHAEPSKLKREDRGYRETSTYGADGKVKDDTRDTRGVFTGVPGAQTAVSPHPLSERGDETCS